MEQDTGHSVTGPVVKVMEFMRRQGIHMDAVQMGMALITAQLALAYGRDLAKGKTTQELDDKLTLEFSKIMSTILTSVRTTIDLNSIPKTSIN